MANSWVYRAIISGIKSGNLKISQLHNKHRCAISIRRFVIIDFGPLWLVKSATELVVAQPSWLEPLWNFGLAFTTACSAANLGDLADIKIAEEQRNEIEFDLVSQPRP